VVKNKKYSKYLPWFELAQKTRDKFNEKGWFLEYQKDAVFLEIIKRINTESFEDSDWQYIQDYEKFKTQVKQFEMSFVEQGMDEKARQIARMMKDNNEPLEKIIAYTGLTAEAIETL
jgi:hypothetical protein